jgi:hypothetical protein
VLAIMARRSWARCSASEMPPPAMSAVIILVSSHLPGSCNRPLSFLLARDALESFLLRRRE